MLALGLAVSAQAGLLFWLSERTTPSARVADPGVRVRQADPRRREAFLVELASVDDPALYALPSERGFAGTGWERAAEFSAPSQEWQEGVWWLTNSPQGLSNRVALRLASAPLGASGGFRDLLPRLSVATPGPLPWITQSSVRVEGDLARRGLRVPLAVPSLVHSNVLGNTVVQVCIDAEGEPYSAVVVRSSGFKAADSKALEVTASARFNPGPADGTGGMAGRWGDLVFQWHVLDNPPGSLRPP
jgi:TonB family protein